MTKYIYDGWYQGINDDENRYALLIDKETRVGYIYISKVERGIKRS